MRPNYTATYMRTKVGTVKYLKIENGHWRTLKRTLEVPLPQTHVHIDIE